MRWMRWKKTFKRWKIFFQRLSGERKFFTATSRMRWKKIFHRYHQNAVKKNFSPLPAECGEKKFFTAKIANLRNIHRANFNAYLLFTGNIIKVSERWRSGLPSWPHIWGRGSNPCTAVFFVRIPVNAEKKNFSPQNSTLFLQKFTAFSAFNAKRCGRFALKKVFFHRYSPLILHYFLSKPRPGQNHLDTNQFWSDLSRE